MSHPCNDFICSGCIFKAYKCQCYLVCSVCIKYRAQVARMSVVLYGCYQITNELYLHLITAGVKMHCLLLLSISILSSFQVKYSTYSVNYSYYVLLTFVAQHHVRYNCLFTYHEPNCVHHSQPASEHTLHL